MADVTTRDSSSSEAARKSKVVTPEEAVSELIPDRCPSLWVGGMHMHNVPMALVRECIRQGKRFETLYAGPSVSLPAELLLGAGLVERVVCSYIGFEHLGLAPVFRRGRPPGGGPCALPAGRRVRERHLQGQPVLR